MKNVLITKPITQISTPFQLKVEEQSVDTKSNDERRVSIIKLPSLLLQFKDNRLKIRVSKMNKFC